MVTESRFFANITNTNESSANALGWLAYGNYVTRRDENYKPFINARTDCVQQYQYQVYQANNDLYAFLTRCELMEQEGFVMDCKTLRS